MTSKFNLKQRLVLYTPSMASSFAVKPGEKVAVVGESGCGKSVTALSIMRLVAQPPGIYAGGSLIFEDRDLLELSEREMQKIRGGQIGMIFQDPMACLNPTMTIGKQIAEGLRLHLKLSASEAHKRAISLLEQVGIPVPTERINAYPHQFSGGMRQRVMIAIALACNPKLLIADEPTTALDVTVQAQILELISGVCQEFGTSLIIITHDLGVVAGLADRVVVMYAGKVIEEGTTTDIFENPRHPYTLGLLESVPRLDEKRHSELKNHRWSTTRSFESAHRLSFYAPLLLRAQCLSYHASSRNGVGKNNTEEGMLGQRGPILRNRRTQSAAAIRDKKHSWRYSMLPPIHYCHLKCKRSSTCIPKFVV